MEILDMLTGGDSAALGEQDIAADMLKDSKFFVISLAAAVGEISHPELRQFFSHQLISAVEAHYRLSDLVTTKDWFHPQVPPGLQLSFDTEETQSALRQNTQQ